MNPRRWEDLKIDGGSKSATQLSLDLVVGSFAYHEDLDKEGWVCLHIAKAAPIVGSPHRNIQLIDGTGNTDTQIMDCVHQIIQWWRAKWKVAVLCRSGANRAPAIAAGAMYASGRSSSVYGAIEWMRAHRKEVGHYRDTTSEVEMAVHRNTKVTLLGDLK